MATAKGGHKSIITNIYFVCVCVKMDLSVTERSVEANVKICAFTNETHYHNILSSLHNN